MDRRDVREKLDSRIDGQFEHIGDRQVAILDLQGGTIEAFTAAFATVHIQIGQKIHFDFPQPVALALFATAAFRVKAEAARAETALLRLAGRGVKFANVVEHARVSRRIAARRASQRRLVHGNHFVDRLDAVQRLERSRLSDVRAKFAAQRRHQGLIHQGAFPTAAHPRHADEAAQRKMHIQRTQVVQRSPAQHDRPLPRHWAPPR